MWRFIQNTLSSFLGTLLALFILGIGSFFMLLMIGLAFQQPVIDVPDEAVLVVDLSMSINDKPPSVTIDQALQEAIGGRAIPQVGLRNLLNAIKYAKTDDGIKGIHGPFPSGQIHMAILDRDSSPLS